MVPINRWPERTDALIMLRILVAVTLSGATVAVGCFILGFFARLAFLAWAIGYHILERWF